MRRLGTHSFAWTGGQTQDDLGMGIETSAGHGDRATEFVDLRPELFDLDRLGQRTRSLGVEIGVTMGLPPDQDVSSEDQAVVAKGWRTLPDAVTAVRDIGGTKLGGILDSAHAYGARPTGRGWGTSAEVLAEVAEEGHAQGAEVVNRFETTLLDTTAQGLRCIEGAGSPHLRLHLDTVHMTGEEASPAAAIRLAGDKLGPFRVGESNRGDLGGGVIDFDPLFDALLDIGHARGVAFESVSAAIVDEGLSLACAIWRDAWTENHPPAAQAGRLIEMKMGEARRRRAPNARA